MERISSASRSRGRLRIALPDLVWIDRCGGRSDGRLHQAVRRVPGLRLSLLRSHCHSRLSDGAVATRAGGALLPRHRRRRRGQQGGAEPADERLSALGGSLCAQSFDPDRVGREGGAQGGPRAAVATSDGAARRVRCLLHLQKHGARADLPRQPAEISEQGPALPHPRASAQPLHALLLLHPRRGARADGPVGSVILSLPDRLLPQRPQLHRAGAEAGGGAGIGFRKHDNAFLAVADPAALQAAADRLSPDIIRRRLDYWTLILGPKFSKKERAQLNLSRLYAISQVEYCRNFIFKRHF